MAEIAECPLLETGLSTNVSLQFDDGTIVEEVEKCVGGWVRNP